MTAEPLHPSSERNLNVTNYFTFSRFASPSDSRKTKHKVSMKVELTFLNSLELKVTLRQELLNMKVIGCICDGIMDEILKEDQYNLLSHSLKVEYRGIVIFFSINELGWGKNGSILGQGEKCDIPHVEEIDAFDTRGIKLSEQIL